VVLMHYTGEISGKPQQAIQGALDMQHQIDIRRVESANAETNANLIDELKQILQEIQRETAGELQGHGKQVQDTFGMIKGELKELRASIGQLKGELSSTRRATEATSAPVIAASSSGKSNPVAAAPSVGTSESSSSTGNCIPAGSKLTVTDVKDATGKLKFRMAVYKGDFISSEIMEKQFWEIRKPQELADMADGTIPKTGTFLDIGGNIGWYSLMFAAHGYSTVTIEPLPKNLDAIRASICLNPGFSELMQLFPVALSDPTNPDIANHPCRVIGDGWESNWDNGRLQCGPNLKCGPPGSMPPCIMVKPTTLDAVLKEAAVTSLAAVKMDIEGQECNVMKQSDTLFNKLRPPFIQYEGKDGTIAVCMAKILKSHNYNIGTKRGHDGNTVAYPVGDKL